MENEAPKRKPLSPEKAHAKAESYCAYQERSQQEVRDKLYDWGLYSTQVEQLISTLIQDNFLNEERFANAYAQGKLRIKGWGKNKIAQGLKFKQVSVPLVKKALKNLNETEYLEKLKEVLDKKQETIKEKTTYQKNFKLVKYALSRGFERDLIFFMLKDSEL